MSARRKPRSLEYDEYLRWVVWAALRRWKLDAADHRCQVCNHPDDLQVHHRTYENFGQERECDLIVLCDECHRRHHGIEDKPSLDVDYERPNPGIIANPARWGQYANRVAEIARELVITSDPAKQANLLTEKMEIARLRDRELRTETPT